MTQDSYLGESGTPPSLHRYLYAYSNPLVFIDLLGYATISSGNDLELELGFDSGSQAVQPLTQSIAENMGLPNADWDPTRGSDYVPLKRRNEALNKFGISLENAQSSAVLTVEDGEGAEEVKAQVLEYLGKGFEASYNSNKELAKVFNERFADVLPGDIVNISDFWQMAVADTMKRAAEAPGSKYWQDIYYGQGKLWDGTIPVYSKMLGAANFNSIVANDELAPPSMQLESQRNTALEVIGSVGTLGSIGINTLSRRMARFGALENGLPKASKRGLKYASRIRQRAIQDPGGHNFPFSFDKSILSTKPTTLRGGGQGYALRGFKNNKEVVYNMIVKDGKITHRDMVSVTKWKQRAKSFGWDIKVNDIPTKVGN